QGILTPKLPNILFSRGQVLLGNAVALLFLEVQAPLAQLVHPNAKLPCNLRLCLFSSSGQPHRLKLEFSGVVPAFLAFHDTALPGLLCLLGTVHETWVGSRSATTGRSVSPLSFPKSGHSPWGKQKA